MNRRHRGQPSPVVIPSAARDLGDGLARSWRPAAMLLATVALILQAIAAQATPMAADPPASEGSFAPAVSVGSSGLLLTWLEPRPAAQPGHRLRFARRDASGWSTPSTIAEGTDFFANWADVPGVVEAGDGALLAHWLRKVGAGTYAYSIAVARSTDAGRTWEGAGWLNDDNVATEHGFVSWVPEPKGARAFWLDGREMEKPGGAMTMRSASVPGVSASAKVPPGAVAGRDAVELDSSVCECCPTSSVALARGGRMVAYRDRSAEEIRDIAVVRLLPDGRWSEPQIVHTDGWKIAGCPVNGPALAANAQGTAAGLAWFTGADDRPRVQFAWWREAGGKFSAPVSVDFERPIGRVGLVLAGSDAIVSWVGAARPDGSSEVRARRITASGRSGPIVQLATTSGGRSSGIPRIASYGGQLWVFWTAEAPKQLRAARLSLEAVPAPRE